MKISVISDIHLEFGGLDLPGGDILFLPGDIVVADFLRNDRTDKDARNLRKISDKFFFGECSKYNKVFMISGNHEHYRGVFDNTSALLRDYLQKTNVTFLDNEFYDLSDEYRIFGATLWTDYAKEDWFSISHAKKNMSDYHVILKDGNRKFTVHDAIDEHKKTLSVMREEFPKTDKKIIVMSHHAPSYKSIHDYYRGDALNPAYVTELSEMILSHTNIRYWFHGHLHDPSNYMIGECNVICNPRGYAKYETNPDFNINFEIEV